MPDPNDTAVVVPFDPTTPANIRDPYTMFANLRTTTPVFYSVELNAWVVTGYDQVESIILDHERFSNAAAIQAPPGLDPLAVSLLADFGWTPNFDTDPPEHTRIRQAVTLAFTARRIAALEGLIRRVANELIDRLTPEDGDMVARFCLPFPAQVIFGMLGVPDQDLERVHLWTKEFIELYIAQIVDDRDVIRAGHCVDYWNYCIELIEARVDHPGDDLISGLVTGIGATGASAVDPPLSTAEIASICMLLVVAGHETTSNLLGNLLLHLLGDRANWEAVCRDRDLIPAAVEEALRIDAPVQVLHRVTTCPVVIDNVAVPSGAKVLVPFGAANHDPKVFADPDRFDLGRSRTSRHLAFSKGAHYCLGVPLARLEGRVALEVLTERLPDLRLAETTVAYHPIFSIRSLERLAVCW